MSAAAASLAGALVALVGLRWRPLPPPRSVTRACRRRPPTGAGRPAAVLAAIAAGTLLGWMLALVVAVVAGGVYVRRRAVRTRRTAAALRAALPDAIELFVMCIHAGRSPVQALHEVAPRAPPALQPAFAAVQLQLHRGATLADALAELPRLAGPPARELAVLVAAAERDGLPLAPVLDRLALEAREARRRQGETMVRQLPVRLSFPLVACILPAFVLLALAPAVLGALSTLRGLAP